MKKHLFLIIVTAFLLVSLSSCKKVYNVQLNTNFWWEWPNDVPDDQNIYVEMIISGDNGTHQTVNRTIYSSFNHWYGTEDFTNYFDLEKGNYTVKFRCYANVWDSDGYHPFENTQTKNFTVDYSGTYHLYFDEVKFYYTKPSGGGGGGGGGGSTTITDNQGHVLTGWELQSNGNYHKKFTANYVVSGNWQAYPSNTNWTYTVTVAYRPASGTYMLYEPFFNPSSNQGLGLGYTGITWGYNSVRVHTYTHYDYDTHVMYEADCYCRFTVQ